MTKLAVVATWLLAAIGCKEPVAENTESLAEDRAATEDDVEEYVATRIESNYSRVADSAIESYEMARRSDDKSQMCGQAQLVVAALLQAKDEERYKEWVKVRVSACGF